MAQTIKDALEAAPQREAINTATGEVISDVPLAAPVPEEPVRVSSAAGDAEPGY
jgi:hypothetical protein